MVRKSVCGLLFSGYSPVIRSGSRRPTADILPTRFDTTLDSAESRCCSSGKAGAITPHETGSPGRITPRRDPPGDGLCSNRANRVNQRKPEWLRRGTACGRTHRQIAILDHKWWDGLCLRVSEHEYEAHSILSWCPGNQYLDSRIGANHRQGRRAENRLVARRNRPD